MTLDISVVASFGIISSIFAYYAFQMRNNDEELVQKLALLLFFMSLVFVNLLMYSIYLMVQNDPSYSYLQTGIMNTGILVMIWTSIILSVALLASIVYLLIAGLYAGIMRITGLANKNEGDDD